MGLAEWIINDTCLVVLAFRHFEIVIFTAGLKIFADAVLNAIDPNQEFFSHRLFRDSCYIKDGKYIKNLSILDRDLDRTILVDDSVEAFGFQPSNGVWIPRWMGNDPEDCQLLKLQTLLDEIQESKEDVTSFLEKKFALKYLLSYN